MWQFSLEESVTLFYLIISTTSRDDINPILQKRRLISYGTKKGIEGI